MAEVPRLGARGGGWVALQFALMGAILVLGVAGPSWPDGARWWLKGAGVVLVFCGAALFASAVRALGAGLTVFPKPPDDGVLAQGGPYGVVRHPLYSGGILVFAGIALALSPWALAGTAALAVTWAFKARVEERFLAARFPEYEAYRASVRFLLCPFVY